MIHLLKNKIIYKKDKEFLLLEAWGKNGIRVRATQNDTFDEKIPSGFLDKDLSADEGISGKDGKNVWLQNGQLKCVLTETGKLKFLNQKQEVILEEYERNRFRELLDGDFYSALEIEPRTYQPIQSTQNYRISLKFESYDNEKLFGMGQYQQPYLNLKGCRLELAQRNSQVTIPFLLSNRGYGFLWNHPGIGTVSFAKNITEWKAESAKQIDYWVCAGDTPSQIVESYAGVTGTVPMMPEYGLGFWQCKLRYQKQEELLEVAREYKKRNIPLDVIVADFFHWPHQGDWRFDPDYWPNPKAMVDELETMGIKLMVSVWPTVEDDSDNYKAMEEEGYLIRTDFGKRNRLLSDSAIFDATNPEARSFVWKKLKKNYYDAGVRIFWLDEAEPEINNYEYLHYRFHLGSDMEIGNVYPREYARMAFEGMKQEGQKDILNLIRCAWIGSQKYGALVWSGDIDSSFKSLKNQIVSGLNMGLSGIPWWTTDIGGFCGADIRDENFKELLIRWFQFGTFCPVMRLHGYRKPFFKPLGTTGGGKCGSGAANEIWSYGPEVYKICKNYILLREKIRPYIRKLMQEAHDKGTPIMRPLFFEFPNDENCWNIQYQYMFGTDLLICPVIEENVEKITVYLPEGSIWKDIWNGEEYKGGNWISANTPLNQIPVFIKDSNEELYKMIVTK